MPIDTCAAAGVAGVAGVGAEQPCRKRQWRCCCCCCCWGSSDVITGIITVSMMLLLLGAVFIQELQELSGLA
jgi:hypothetical protein